MVVAQNHCFLLPEIRKRKWFLDTTRPLVPYLWKFENEKLEQAPDIKDTPIRMFPENSKEKINT